jgi:integrase
MTIDDKTGRGTGDDATKTSDNRKRTRGRTPGFRLRRRGKKLYAEVRKTENGKVVDTFYVKFEEGTQIPDANKMMGEILRDRQSASIGAPGVESSTLKRFRVGDLIEGYRKHSKLAGLRAKTASLYNEDKMLIAFLRHEKTICQLTLSDSRKINAAIKALRTRRMQEGDISEFSIDQELSPLRRIFRHASDILFAVLGYHIDVPNPTLGINWSKWNQEEMGRKRFLKLEDDEKIYDAILEQSPVTVYRARWLTLVNLALTTALRRGVLLNLKWEDIDHKNKIINIPKTYWNGKKRAPPMVPLTKRLAADLKQYYDVLPELERKPHCKLFPEAYERAHMYEPDTFVRPRFELIQKIAYGRGVSKEKVKEELIKSDKYLVVQENLDCLNRPKQPRPRWNKLDGASNEKYEKKFGRPFGPPGQVDKKKWADLAWKRIIRRTDLWIPLVRNGQAICDDNGNPKKDWFHFHDLRHTATTRYASPKMYGLASEEYEYLLGKVPHGYNHQDHIEMCDGIRVKLEAGDEKIARHMFSLPADGGLPTKLIDHTYSQFHGAYDGPPQ